MTLKIYTNKTNQIIYINNNINVIHGEQGGAGGQGQAG